MLWRYSIVYSKEKAGGFEHKNNNTCTNKKKSVDI